MKRKIIIFVALICVTALIAGAHRAGTQERISSIASNCSNPRVIVNASGDTFVVWQGSHKGRWRIFFRELQKGKWRDETLIDRTDAGDNTDPAIALDDKGNPHIVWVLTLPGHSEVRYAFRLQGEWIYPGALHTSLDKNCEFPEIAVQPETNRLFITWQEGRGSRYAIFCATQDRKGRFTSVKVSSPLARGYNLYPQIFIAPTPFVTWYESGESDFILRAALFNIQTEKWMRYDPDGLENLPANRLPFLTSDLEGLLYALWYDSDGATDRIYFARQGDASTAAGSVVDDNPKQMNNLPAGKVSRDGQVYVCWRGESIFGGQIFIMKGNALTGEFKESNLVSDGQNLFYTHPSCAIAPGGSISIVWVSSVLDGGDGAIYFRHLHY